MTPPMMCWLLGPLPASKNEFEFLAADDASFITGVVLPVDSGKTPRMHIPDFDLTALNNQNID
jgi:hypothetical protein